VVTGTKFPLNFLLIFFTHVICSQTKWVAEKLMREARQGIPIAIYRPGDISGHTETGASNESDFFIKFLCGCIHLGCYPEANGGIEMIPVDFVAKAIGTQY
jgi:thioester reductase-like protein